MPQPFGTNEAAFLDVALHSLLYGVYASIFTVYLRLPTRKRHGTLGYILMVLFTLITIFYMLDITQAFYTIFGTTSTDADAVATINVFTSAIYTLSDYIAQSILIYRCWVMWGRRWWIVSFPLVSSLMAFIGGFILTVFLGKLRHTPELTPSWFFPLGTGSFAVSLGTNASVAVLLIIKLYQIHKQLKYAPDGAGGAPKDIRAAIGVFMETGVLMFVGQLLWVVLFGLQNPAFSTVGGPVTQIYGITPTLVIVRVASGMAYETAETRVANTTHFGIETDGHHGAPANTAPRRPSTADSKTKSASTDHDIELGTI